MDTELGHELNSFQNLPDELVMVIFTKLSNSDAPFDTLNDLKLLVLCSTLCKRFQSLVCLIPTLSIKHPSCKTLYVYCPKILNTFKHIRSLQVKHWSCTEICMNNSHKQLPTVYFDAAYRPHSYCLLVVSYKTISYYSDLQVRDSLMLLDAPTEDGEVQMNSSSWEHTYDLFRLHHMLVSSIKDHTYLQTVEVTDFTNRGMFTLEEDMLVELRNCSRINLDQVQVCERSGSMTNLDIPFGNDLCGVVLNEPCFNIMEWSENADDPIHEAEEEDDDAAAAGARDFPVGLPFKGSRGVLLKNYLGSLLENSAHVHVDNENNIHGMLSDLYYDNNLL